jgi:hypothetical protein
MGWTAGLPDFWLNEDGTCRRSSSEITQRNGSIRYGTECEIARQQRRYAVRHSLSPCWLLDVKPSRIEHRE